MDLLPHTVEGRLLVLNLGSGESYRFLCSYGRGAASVSATGAEHLFRDPASATLRDSAVGSALSLAWPSPPDEAGGLLLTFAADSSRGILAANLLNDRTRRLVHSIDTIYWNPRSCGPGGDVVACYAKPGEAGLLHIAAESGRIESIAAPPGFLVESPVFDSPHGGYCLLQAVDAVCLARFDVGRRPRALTSLGRFAGGMRPRGLVLAGEGGNSGKARLILLAEYRPRPLERLGHEVRRRARRVAAAVRGAVSAPFGVGGGMLASSSWEPCSSGPGGLSAVAGPSEREALWHDWPAIHADVAHGRVRATHLAQIDGQRLAALTAGDAPVGGELKPELLAVLPRDFARVGLDSAMPPLERDGVVNCPLLLGGSDGLFRLDRPALVPRLELVATGNFAEMGT